MYILKNALKSITRTAVRNVLIAVITVVITVAACVALCIRQSAQTVEATQSDNLKITAQIQADNYKMRQQMETQMSQNGGDSSSGQRPRINFQRPADLALTDLQKYAKSSDVESFYYTVSTSMSATGDLTAVDSSGSGSSDTTTTTTAANGGSGGPGGDYGGGFRQFAGMGQVGDFTVVGYSSQDAMTQFMPDGTCKVTSGSAFDPSSADLNCLISDTLATQNSLKVGDTVTLANPNVDTETTVFTVVGIYNNSAETSSDSGGQMRGFSTATEPANQIYVSAAAIQPVIDASVAANPETTQTDDQGNSYTTSQALRGQTSGTYVFADQASLDKFATMDSNGSLVSGDVMTMGLDSSTYTVSSPDATAREAQLTPVKSLSSNMFIFLLVVLGIGGIILVVFHLFAIRERKYEIGVLAAIGMKKVKVAAQFVAEVCIVTVISVIIGAVVGAAVSVPVANSLLASQVTAAQSANSATDQNFGANGFQGRGFQGGGQGAMFFGGPGQTRTGSGAAVNYIDKINAAIDLNVVWQLLLIGLLLAVISSIVAIISIVRYQPLKILSSRT